MVESGSGVEGRDVVWEPPMVLLGAPSRYDLGRGEISGGFVSSLGAPFTIRSRRSAMASRNGLICLGSRSSGTRVLNALFSRVHV